MKIIITIIAATFTLAACVATPLASDDASHGATHDGHAHVHGENCGHQMVQHGDHWDYLHDGHMHYVHGDHVDDHVLEVTDTNPATETVLAAVDHAGHMHSEDDAAHPAIPHGDHIDHIHNGRLHHVHGDHVDDHGPVTVKENS